MPAMMPLRFRGSSSYGDAVLVSTSLALGTGGTAVTASATTSALLPKPACTSCQLVGLRLDALVAAISAGGTVLLQVFKRDNSGTPADRTLTAATSLEAGFITVADASYSVPITATAIQNVTFQASDAARVDIVSDAAIGTAPAVVLVGIWAIITP